jgi:signal transduction histidine kinase
MDHSRRLTSSELLPKKYQVDRGLNFLPTNARILGAVQVNTGEEHRWLVSSGVRGLQPLEIAITRDRLIDNDGFTVVRKVVRASLDFYAMREAARELKQAESRRRIDRAGTAVNRVADIVERYTQALPPAAVAEIKAAVKEATEAVDIEQDVQRRQANLLGALATAGMAAAAFEHESARQMRRLEALATRLYKLADRAGSIRAELRATAEEMRSWIKGARATGQLFTAIAEPESREQRHRLKARSVLEQVIARLGPLMRGVPVDLSRLAPDIRLPSGTFVEWSALFQNVLVNAVNATLDKRDRRIAVTNRNEGVARVILLQDTGVGVDLDKSDELFEPFVRRLRLSASRSGLGIGGTGLGLAVVRMIATNLGCRVSFTTPQDGFATALRIAWSERS